MKLQFLTWQIHTQATIQSLIKAHRYTYAHLRPRIRRTANVDASILENRIFMFLQTGHMADQDVDPQQTIVLEHINDRGAAEDRVLRNVDRDQLYARGSDTRERPDPDLTGQEEKIETEA